MADTAVRHFHEQLNTGHYEAIYRQADEGFSRGQNHDDAIRFLETIHNQLGLAAQENQLSIRVDTNTYGTFLTTFYRTQFATGTATETFTWVRSGRTLKLYGYHIQSSDLMLDNRNPAAQNAKAVR